MAWTTPRTWSTGEVVTASMMNTDIRDNVGFLHDPPEASVRKAAAQAIADNTVVYHPFDTERYDTNTIHDTGANTSRLTCKTAGRYDIWGNIVLEALTGRRIISIELNRSGVYLAREERNNATSAAEAITVSRLGYPLIVNDYVELAVYQNSGASKNSEVLANAAPEFAMRRVSA